MTINIFNITFFYHLLRVVHHIKTNIYKASNGMNTSDGHDDYLRSNAECQYLSDLPMSVWNL